MDEYDSRAELLESFGKHLEPEDYYFRGVLNLLRNNFDSALEAIGKAIELKPDSADAWNIQGIILGQIKNYDKALDAFDDAIKLKPDFAEAWYNRACVYSLKGDKENTLKNLFRAIELNTSYKEMAKSDEDFKNLWNDEDFKKIAS